jgi:hypothetical protein
MMNDNDEDKAQCWGEEGEEHSSAAVTGTSMHLPKSERMFPHMVIHHIRECDDDIPWIPVPSHGFHNLT